MARPIELIPLVCLNCSTPIPAEQQRDGLGVRPMRPGDGAGCAERADTVSRYITPKAYSPRGAASPTGWPTGRSACSGKSTVPAARAPRKPCSSGAARGSFVIPAYSLPQEDLLAQTTRFLLQPPALKPGPQAPFEPVTLSMDDIHPVAEFIVMAIEAGRKDMLKDIHFSLELSRPSLWILP